MCVACFLLGFLNEDLNVYTSAKTLCRIYPKLPVQKAHALYIDSGSDDDTQWSVL